MRHLSLPAVALVLAACVWSPAQAEEARVYGLGTVEARILSRLGFDVAGTLSLVAVDQGDRVTRGQALASLTQSDQLARVAQAEAALVQARAGIGLAHAKLERARTLAEQRGSVNSRRQALVKRGTVSAEAAEDAEASAQVAVADVAVAKAELEAAKGAQAAAEAALALEKALLGKLTLNAPFDGLIIERTREVGSAVTAGASVLGLADPGTVWVTAFVDEALAGKVGIGQKAEITLRSQPGKSFSGRVARIDLENDRVSEERKVQVAFDAIPSPFTLGEQAEVLIVPVAGRP